MLSASYIFIVLSGYELSFFFFYFIINSKIMVPCVVTLVKSGFVF